MKIITTVLFLMVLFGNTYAQFLVVDNSSSGGSNIPIQDTILSSIDPVWGSCTSINFDLDLDQDSIPDIVFYLECYMGGMGSYYEMSLTSFNDFSIHVDTSYIEHFQVLDSVGQAQNTIRKTPVVRKYNFGDTIFNNQAFLATEEKLLDYSYGNYPSCVYNNINLFFEDTSYIVFEKSNSDLYYLKIQVPNLSAVELIYAKTNGQIKDINENIIFPNPANEKIRFRIAFDLIQIYNTQGTLLIEKEMTNNRKKLDISYLKSGLYLVILKTDNNRYIEKFIKL